MYKYSVKRLSSKDNRLAIFKNIIITYIFNKMNTWNEIWKVTDDLIRSTSTAAAPISATETSTTTSTTSSSMKIRIPLGSALKSFFTSDEITEAKETLFNQLDDAIKVTATSSTVSLAIVAVIAAIFVASLVVHKLKKRKEQRELLTGRCAASAPTVEHLYSDCNQIRCNELNLDSVTSSSYEQNQNRSQRTMLDAQEC